jgi:hypothetical protein
MDDTGVYQVYENSQALEARKPVYNLPSVRDYFMDLDYILGIISDGPAKSFAYRRLRCLESKWNLYYLLNEYQELADSKVIWSLDVTVQLSLKLNCFPYFRECLIEIFIMFVKWILTFITLLV